jgi:tetratricopeptide (TPR) repeat protein
VTAPPLSQKKPDDQASGKSNKETSGKSIAAVISPKENPPSTHESVSEPAARTADTSGSALFREAVALLNSGRIGQAKSAFQHVRAVAPRYPELEAYLGTIAAFEEKTHTGISAFFRGEYTEAIENLSATSKNGSDNPHVYAFLACSYAAEYLLAGAENGNLKKEAVAAFGKVKGIDPRYELDAELISPGIIALLKGE